jgi:hypothetical protein
MRWDTIKSAPEEEYGLGFRRVKKDGRYYFGHGGGFPGFITATLIDPKEKITVVVLTNALGGAAMKYAKRIVDFLHLFEKEKYSQASKKLDEYEGRYEGIWGTSDVINISSKLICFGPTDWNVPKDYDELKKLKGDTFTVESSDGYGHQGEAVTFKRSAKGRIQSVDYAGYLLKKAG